MSSGGGRAVTIADVALASGVSRTTVSHALRGMGRIDATTRAQVKEVARELGYRPSIRAQRLRQGQSKMLGMVSSMPHAVAAGPARLGFYMEVAAAAAESALLRGYALVLTPPVEGGVLLDSLDIDGAIVIEPEKDDSVVADLFDRSLPVVTLGQQPGALVPFVDLGSETVAQLLLDHLYEQGARRVALLIGDRLRDSYLGEGRAYEQWAMRRQLPSIVRVVAEEGGAQAGYRACMELLEEHPGLDGICVAVDAFAVGCVQALAARGLRVPDDVLVVTRYDGILARTSQPPLTAVDLHLGTLAARAVGLLLSELGQHREEGEVPALDPVLIPRRSSLGLSPALEPRSGQ